MGRDTSFFTTIKQEVTLDDYLATHLGVELVPSGPARQAAVCPFHEEDTPSFFVMESDEGPWKRWWCFGACQEGGTVIDAVMKAEGFEEANDAADYLNDLYQLGLEVNSEAYQRFRRTVAETKADIEKTREEFSKDSRQAKAARTYLMKRGLSDETINQFQLGVDTSITQSGRISIPLIDKANHPVSVASRAIFDSGYPCASCKEIVLPKDVVKRRHQARKAEEKGLDKIDWKSCPHCGVPEKEARIVWLTGQDPKYRFLREFDKANLLYNQHEARRALVKDQDVAGLFLVEGQGDAWAGWQSGHRAICAYFGAELSDWQAREAVDLAGQANKPVILVPDFDETGQANIDKNIRKLRAVREDIEIQVLHGIDEIEYKPGVGCKDLGDVLKHFGAEKVGEVLEEYRWAAPEWQVRQIIGATNQRTGESFYSKTRQMELIAEILHNVKTKEALDHLVPYLAKNWRIREDLAQNWFHSNLNPDNVVAVQHLVKDIIQAREEAQIFLSETNVIRLGFDELDACFPGGGARKGQLMMILGKSGTGKTMLASQMLAHMADAGIRSIFFSLEQRAGSFYSRLACQVLDMPSGEVDDMIRNGDPALKTVDEVYKNMYLVDNVPTQNNDAVDMTPGRIQSIIQEVNMTHFEEESADVIIVDHLGILEVGPEAPRDIRGSDVLAPGYIMQELFKVCKSVDVFMIILQQLPKEVPPGMPYSYDAGRGGSKQTDYCDYILQIYRPEQRSDIDEQERLEVEGQYKIIFGKNRYGASTLAHLYFDKSTLRIMPPLQVPQPAGENPNGPVIEIEDDIGSADEILIGSPETPTPSGEVGATQQGVETLVAEKADPVPSDTKALLEQLGAEEEEGPDQIGDPKLLDWFER